MPLMMTYVDLRHEWHQGTLMINIQGNVINIMWTTLPYEKHKQLPYFSFVVQLHLILILFRLDFLWETTSTSLDYALFNFLKFSSIVQLSKQIESISH
jgi:hypothetical protein